MFDKIPGSAIKVSGESLRRFPGMFQKIPENVREDPGNVSEDSGEYSRRFREMFEKIPGNVIKDSEILLLNRYKTMEKTITEQFF